MYTNITGIILSGGKSSRMGTNKSLLMAGGKTIIERVKGLMTSLFPGVILVTNEPQQYDFLGLKIYEDIYKGLGPLAGIHSGLLNSPTEKNFVISCDLPFMTREMVRYLIDFPTEKPITIAKADGFLQQLAGVYHKSLIKSIEDILQTQSEESEREVVQKKRGCRVLSLINSVGVEIINTEALPFYKPDTYFNMNKQSDYDFMIEKLGKDSI